MDYWRGMVDWPIEADWACETCGTKPHFIVAGFAISCGLEWGIQHGICRCSQCHTQYNMRPDGNIVTVPVNRLKDEYKEPARWAWNEWEIPNDELTDKQWDEAVEKCRR